jgi:hypothetical protein
MYLVYRGGGRGWGNRKIGKERMVYFLLQSIPDIIDFHQECFIKQIKEMATSRNNILALGFHGRVGNLVLKMLNGKVVLAAAANYKNHKWSRAQKANRKRFSEAMAYARRALADPEILAFYRKKTKGNQTVWNIAVSDFLLKPQVHNIGLQDYHGKKGDVIHIDATDKYRVAGVIVSIADAQGYEIESGMAVKMFQPVEWIYPVMEHNPKWKGGRITVRVTDSPGNVVSAFRILTG